MALLEEIEERRSRRKYLPVPLDPDVVERLREAIGEYNRIEGVDMRLVLNDGSAFAGLRKSYGMFSGVQDYIGLIDQAADTQGPSEPSLSVNAEKMGYYGELVVLHAVGWGLGTCWVGGTFDRTSCPFDLADGETVACCITLGKVPEEMTTKERLLRGLVRRKTKAAEEMFVADAPVPAWFMEGMGAVQKAPSATNRQPVTFEYRKGKVTAAILGPVDTLSPFDLGIAKLHFQVGAGGGTWGFGNGAAFERAGGQ